MLGFSFKRRVSSVLERRKVLKDLDIISSTINSIFKEIVRRQN
jgi:hypothetical protein